MKMSFDLLKYNNSSQHIILCVCKCAGLPDDTLSIRKTCF